jgi:hypothetical protein
LPGSEKWRYLRVNADTVFAALQQFLFSEKINGRQRQNSLTTAE